MDYKKLNKYFTEGGKLHLFVGLPITVIGLVLTILFVASHSFRLMPIGAVILIAGITLYLVFKGSNLSDDEVDQEVRNRMNDIEAHSSEVFKFPRRYEVLHPNVILGGYDFDREEGKTGIKRGHDLKFRNGYYSGLLMNFTNDGLRIDSRRFSILKDEMKEDILYFKWEEVEGSKIDEAEMETTLVNGKQAKIKYDIYRLFMKDGASYSWVVKNTADVDEAIDCIYRQTVRVKQDELKAKANANA